MGRKTMSNMQPISLSRSSEVYMRNADPAFTFGSVDAARRREREWPVRFGPSPTKDPVALLAEISEDARNEPRYKNYCEWAHCTMF